MQRDRNVELIHSYHTQLKKWLMQRNDENGKTVLYPKLIAATLTFKNSVDEITASRTLTYCLNPINRKLFGKNGNKRGEKLKVIPALETKGNLHFHLLVEIPEGKSVAFVIDLIKRYWKKTINGGYAKIITQVDDGWLDYITKFNLLGDDIDFMNIEF